MKIRCLLLLVVTLHLEAQRSSEVPVRRAREWNSTSSDGWCNFRVQVEDEADFLLNGERLTVISTKGPARDILTECSAPLPTRDESVKLGRIIRGRGDVKLHDPPSARNGWTALLRVIDSQSGPDELEFRLEWGKGETKSGSGSSDSGPVGEYDDRDLSKWPTRQVRAEIEKIYSTLNRRRPSMDDVDDYIDKVRNDNWTLKQVRQSIQGKK